MMQRDLDQKNTALDNMSENLRKEKVGIMVYFIIVLGKGMKGT